MVFSSERKRFLFMSLGSNICLFSVDHHFVHFVCGDVATTSLCLLARTAAHQCSASCGPEKQHSFGGEGFRNGARAVSVGEEQFLAMQLSDSLHQTFVFGSSCVLVRAWERVAGSARSERGLMSSRPHLRGAAKRYTRCSHHVGRVDGRVGVSIGAKEILFHSLGGSNICLFSLIITCGRNNSRCGGRKGANQRKHGR